MRPGGNRVKKIINLPADVVEESLKGLAAAHPDRLAVHFNPMFVTTAASPVADKVAIISGGGSGHEPLHTGFVGDGMLDAACPGHIFTSPTPDQMLEAAKAVDGGSGVLYIVKNYSGDVMNFEMAVELAAAEGIRVTNVVIDDDIAVKDSLYTQGRRGMGVTIFAEKICGAAARAGRNLNDVAALCQRVNQNGRSIGVALTACTVPERGKPTFDLPDDQIEFGIGIHGEPGRVRRAIAPADDLVTEMTDALLTDPLYQRTTRRWNPDEHTWIEEDIVNEPFREGDRFIALVNSMGGTPSSELYIAYNKLAELCEEHGFQIVRNLIGPYITSIDMQGLSISLLRADDEMLDLWDAPVWTPALRWGF